MHDVLFANQDRLGPEDLMAYAAALGLDLAEFRDALAERTYAPKVREDFMSGVRNGVNGTLTFFINGVRHDGPRNFASLLTALQQAAATPVRAQRPAIRSRRHGSPASGNGRELSACRVGPFRQNRGGVIACCKHQEHATREDRVAIRTAFRG
jgi:hypothetical protein